MTLQLVVIIGLCAYAGGYLAGEATLWEDWREKWAASKSDAYGMFFNRNQPSDRSVTRYWYLAKGKFFEALTCFWCAGWHAAWIVLLIANVTNVVDQTAGEAFVTWFAACGLHTALTSLHHRGDEP